MSSKLYAISPRFITTPFNAEIVDNAVTPLGEWIRYNGFLWFVYTRLSSKQISAAVLASLKPGDNALVFAVQPEAATGVADPWVWQWLNEKMHRQFAGLD